MGYLQPIQLITTFYHFPSLGCSIYEIPTNKMKNTFHVHVMNKKGNKKSDINIMMKRLIQMMGVWIKFMQCDIHKS